MSTQITVALISAVVALCVALFSLYDSKQTRKSQKTLEKFKADLEAEKLVTQADLSYQFEARKKLYNVCEPLFFQMQEAAADAVKEIEKFLDKDGQANLVTEREKLVVKDVWMLTNSSALVYTLYALYRPLALFRILRGKISAVDLSLDADVSFRYRLGKELNEALVSDAKIALCEPKLDYDPLAKNWREERTKEPAKYWWQGISPGRLDNALAVMTDEDRVIDFLAFEELHRAAFEGKDEGRNKLFGVPGNLLYGFNPQDRPVGWRVILIMLHLNYALSQPVQSLITQQPQKAGVVPGLFKLPNEIEKKIDQAIKTASAATKSEEFQKVKDPKSDLWRSQSAAAYLSDRFSAYS